MPDDKFIPLLFWFNKDVRLALPARYIVANNIHLFPHITDEMFNTVFNDVPSQPCHKVVLIDDPIV
jgi:hypothetical protein